MGCTIKVIATFNKDAASKQDFDNFGGIAAGVCYMQNTFDELCAEPAEKTAAREKMTKENFHHSVYDHCHVSLYIENMPRVVQALLDTERMMTASVKSGRYTRHALEGRELELYDKWLPIFEDLIRKKYSGYKYFTNMRINKLAMENARYLTGAFARVTTMIHTLSYRQLNYIYGFIRDFVKEKNNNDFIKKLKPYLTEFLIELDKTGYVDPLMLDTGKNRTLALFTKRKTEEYFGDVYCTTYNGSWAYFMQVIRHRTLKYSVVPPNSSKLEFYVPEILSEDPDFVKQWLADLETVKENYPQAALFEITEMGTLDDFILKIYERKCISVQLETMRRTNKILSEYNQALQKKSRDDLQKFTDGSRCTFKNFKCPTPCGFNEGINETRIV